MTFRRMAPSWSLRRADSQGREACRSSSGAARKIRVRDQPKDSKDARPDYSAIAVYYRRRGDRVM